jgi:hypothetical protein
VVKLMLVTVLFSLAACGTQPGGPPDFFHGQAQFDAARARQTTVVDVASTGEACAQVIAVLMDLDCSVQAVNSELGLVSARASVHRVPPGHGQCRTAAGGAGGGAGVLHPAERARRPGLSHTVAQVPVAFAGRG